MRTSTLVTLAIAFVALVGAAVWLVWGQDDDHARGGGSEMAGAPSFATLTERGANSITIGQPGNGKSLNLKRAGGDWKVNGKPADATRIEAFFADVAGIEPDSIASRNAANHERLGVTAAAGRELSWTTNSGKVAVIVGNPGPTVDSFYARAADDDAVYLMSGGLYNYVTQAAADWRPPKDDEAPPATEATPKVAANVDG